MFIAWHNWRISRNNHAHTLSWNSHWYIQLVKEVFFKTYTWSYISTELCFQLNHNSSAESEKGINTGSKMFRSEPEESDITRLWTAIAPFWLEGRYRNCLHSHCALLVLNGTSLSSINAFLALSRRIIPPPRACEKSGTVEHLHKSLPRISNH